ncbi:MAG TPA: cupredoxin domain-containing protein [Actinomycetota bacterium]|nr:cupredoxin domain-containing protein [Actinomycetota bacterium]
MRRAVAAALLVATAACSGGGDAGATREVEVEMRFSRFDPDDFEFPAGTTVTFVVENRDPIDHEFLIGDEEVQRAHEEGTEPHHGAKPGEISVPAGETRTTTYTFEEPGKLLVGCHLPTHWDYGMRGEITVTG